MPTRFQTFSTSVRPFRVAALIDIADHDWQSTCLAIVEFFTKVWGGRHSLIVPTDGTTIHDVFWALLSAYDPDLIFTYRKTGEDLRRNDPEKFGEIVASEVQKSSPKDEHREQLKTEIMDALLRAGWDAFRIGDDLSRKLITRLAPLCFEGKLERHTIQAGADPVYPLTSVLDVVDQVDNAGKVINITNDSTVPTLWLAASLGWLTPEYVAALRKKGVIGYEVTSRSPTEAIRLGIQPWEGFSGQIPFDISNVGLSTVRGTRAREFHLPTVFVLGDSISDFCLYYGLLHLHHRAVWLPKWFLEDDGDGFQHRLISAIRRGQELSSMAHSDSNVLTSASVSTTELENVASSLNKTYSYASLAIEPLSTSFVRKLVQHPIRLYTRRSIAKLSTQQLVDDEVPGPMESPVPTTFKIVNPQLHRWIVEIDFRKHRIPRHPALGSFMASGRNLDDNAVRTTNAGLAYVCPGGFVIGTDPDFNLLWPTIRVPSAIDIFRRTFKFGGYDCEISDKGRYESETITKFGGVEAAGEAFRDERTSALLHKFCDCSRSAKGGGAFLKDQRRYLDFPAISNLLGNDQFATEIIDRYISKKILYRGLILACKTCSSVTWFSIDQIGHTFTCPRCGDTQGYNKGNWRDGNEPAWFYKLDEVVYLAVVNNSAVPILTLGALRRETRRADDSFLFCPELRINSQGDKKHIMELDICCIPDGKLCIGEAKRNGKLATTDASASERAAQYRDLADRIGASRVVFSTLDEHWDKASQSAISSAFTEFPQIEVSTLVASDL